MPCKATHTDVDRDGGGGGSVDDEEDHCFYPLVSPGDPITLQLWVYSPDYNNEGLDDVNVHGFMPLDECLRVGLGEGSRFGKGTFFPVEIEAIRTDSVGLLFWGRR